jgi:hypothetical protein
MKDWIDCIQDNVGRYDNDCVLDPGGSPYMVSSTIYFWRRNVTIDGAWPWPELLRAVGFTGDLMKSGNPRTSSYPAWVTIQNVHFHGNRWRGATSSSFELNLFGCSYCIVTANALFMDSPYYALGVDPSVPIAVGPSVNFRGVAYGAMYNGDIGNGPGPCRNPTGWYPNVCLNVTGNTFYGSGVGAIGPAPKIAQLASNTFTGNHSECSFDAPGGQIDLDEDADSIMVVNNTFQNGPSCANEWWADGVELHGTRIILTDNAIEYNAGDGIYMAGAQGVTINSSDPGSWPISNNNEKGSGNFCGAGGFSGIEINAAGNTQDITVNNVWTISGHSHGIRIFSCSPGAPSVNVTITNNCADGNEDGIHDDMNCSEGTCILNNQQVYDNQAPSTGGGKFLNRACVSTLLRDSAPIITMARPTPAEFVAANSAFFQHLFATTDMLSGVHQRAYFDQLGLSAAQRALIRSVTVQYQKQESSLRQQFYATVSQKDPNTPSQLDQIRFQRNQLLTKTAIQLLGALGTDGLDRIQKYLSRLYAALP